MQEIVTVGGVTRLFAALAVLTPIFGIGWAFFGAAHRRNQPRVRYTALLIGLSGPANGCLWQLYNLLTNINGLDTVRNFAVNVTVFLVIGLIVGIVLGRTLPTADAPTTTALPTNEAEPNDIATED